MLLNSHMTRRLEARIRPHARGDARWTAAWLGLFVVRPPGSLGLHTMFT